MMILNLVNIQLLQLAINQVDATLTPDNLVILLFFWSSSGFAFRTHLPRNGKTLSDAT